MRRRKYQKHHEIIEFFWSNPDFGDLKTYYFEKKEIEDFFTTSEKTGTASILAIASENNKSAGDWNGEWTNKEGLYIINIIHEQN